jgi:hypothetical protein
LSRELLARPQAWELVTFAAPDEVPNAFLAWQLQPA